MFYYLLYTQWTAKLLSKHSNHLQRLSLEAKTPMKDHGWEAAALD